MTRFLLALLSLLTYYCFCVGEQHGSFTLTVSGSSKTIQVIRGKSVPITSDHFSMNASGDGNLICNIVYVGDTNEHCGHVSPSTRPCWDPGSPQVFSYQHYGCLNHYEVLNFRIEAWTGTSGDELIVKVVSLPVHVLPNPRTSLQIKISQDDHRNIINFFFPVSFANHCSYTVLDHLPSLSYGKNSIKSKINGPLSLPLPCGYSPRVPFTYNNSLSHMSLVVHSNCFTDRSTTFYVLPLPLREASNDSAKQQQQRTTLKQLKDSHLTVTELSETVLPSPALPIDSADFVHFEKEHGNLKFLFPVEHTGGFYSFLSSHPKHNTLDATTFTLDDLKRSKVLFIPKERSIASHVTTISTFHYYLLNSIGKPLAKGALHVKLSPRRGRSPSLRKNTGISVKRGGKGNITSNELNLYPPHLCTNYTATLHSIPSLGKLYIRDEGQPLMVNDTFRVERNNLSILYIQDRNTDGHYASDYTIWRLECDTMQEQVGTMVTPLIVQVPIRIAASFNTSPLPHCIVNVMTYSQTATPLHLHAIKDQCSLPHSPVSIATLKQPPAGPGEFIQTPPGNCSLKTYPYLFLNESCLKSKFVIKNWINASDVLYLSPAVLLTRQVEFTLTNLPTNYTISLRITIHPIHYYYSNITTVSLPPESATPLPFFPSVPYIGTNNPLPITSPHPVYITSNFLSTASIGYLEKEIVYHIVSQPQYGHICLLDNTQCTSSVRSFTQADISGARIYYKLLSNSLQNDSFSFQLFHLSRGERIAGVTIFRFWAIDEESLLVGKQFWIVTGGKKPITRKYLRHVHKYLGTNRLHFKVLSGPHHGILQTPFNQRNFTWEDLKDRIVVYEDKSEGVVCSDLITLQAIRNDNKGSITTNFSIAIKRLQDDRLSFSTKGHKMKEEKLFQLSASNFEIQSAFCLQFITFKITSIPTYGLLQVQDSATNVLKELSINSSFTGQDLIQGRVTYHVLPKIIFYRETTDTFSLSLQDPQDHTTNKNKRSRRNAPSSIYLIVLIEETMSEMRLNLTVASSKIVSALDNTHYGAVFGKNDIYLSPNSDFVPSEIFLYIKPSSPPRFGQLQKDNVQVSHFSLAEVYANKISYISRLSHSTTSVTSDMFELIMRVSYGEDGDESQIEGNLSVLMEWCYFNITGNSEVDESASYAKFFVSYTGGLNINTASVNVTTKQMTGVDDAATGHDCTSSPLASSPDADYCNTNTRVTLSSLSKKQVIRVRILNDTEAESRELLRVGLTDPETCIIPRHLKADMYITDYIDDKDDYSFIGFSKDHNHHRLLYQTDNEDCSFSLLVPESIGTFNITLHRTQNTKRRDTIICYTSPQLSNDYIPRPNNSSSPVVFEQGQVHSNCSITIIDDRVNEPQTRFIVYLGEPIAGHAFRNDSSDRVCVYIDHDEADVPHVFFRETRLIVHEKPNSQSYASFTIYRTGDLSGVTNVSCRLAPNKQNNATRDRDYSYKDLSNIISFSVGQSKAKGQIRIFSDGDKEGIEVFYVSMKKPYNGHISGTGELEVVILDVVEDIIIKFPSKMYLINENTFITKIPVHRSGNLSAPTAVNCSIEPVTANDTDYYIILQTLTFAENETKKDCLVIIRDDDKREMNETLRLVLSSNDPRVRAGETLIIIDDQEDAPVVEFEETVVYITEPISNFEVDHTEVRVPINRSSSGLNVNAAVQYYTVDENEDVHYSPVKGKIKFDIGVKRKYISIRVYSNHSSHNDRKFYVHLKAEADTRLGTLSTSTVIVKNRILKGVYFPANPVIQSYINKTNQLNSENRLLRNYDLPLICKTACDYFEGKTECTRQGIDVAKTRYKWFISKDQKRFDEVNIDTMFTSSASQLLSPIYLRANVWIKCVAEAVDMSGVKGYSRTSSALRLGNERFQKSYVNVEAKFVTYNSFQGNDKDFVELVVILPVIPNSIPILTSKPVFSPFLSVLTQSAMRKRHVCSSLSPSSSRTSFMSRETSRELALYGTNGAWVFRKWLSLKSLLNECPISLSKKSFNLTMPLYVSHVTVNNRTLLVRNESKYNLTLQHEKSSHNTSVPFNYYPTGKSREFYFSPHAIDTLFPGSKIRLIGYSHFSGTLYQNVIIRMSLQDHPEVSIPPVTAEENEGESIHSWIIETDQKNISFKINLCQSNNNGLRSCNRFDFNIPVEERDNKLFMSSKVESHAVMVSDREGTHIKGNNVLKLSVYLHQSSILKPNYKLAIDRVIFQCSGSCDHLENDTIDAASIPGKNQSVNSSHIIMYFSLDELHQIIGRQEWQIITSSRIESSNHHIVLESQTITKLPPLPVRSSPTAGSPRATTAAQAPSTLPLYAFMLILITAVILTSLCTITCALLGYTLRQKWLLKKERRLIQDVYPFESDPYRLVLPNRSRRQRRHTVRLPISSSSSPQSRRYYPSPSITPNSDAQPSPLQKSRSLPNLSSASPTFDVYGISPPSSTGSESPPTPPNPNFRTVHINMIPIKERHDVLVAALDSISEISMQSNSDTTLQGVGWYDRCKAREKSLEHYYQIYSNTAGGAGASSKTPNVESVKTDHKVSEEVDDSARESDDTDNAIEETVNEDCEIAEA